MSDVKSVQPPRPVLSAGVPGPAPAPVARKSDGDDKSVSTDVVPASSSASSPFEELRKALVTELVNRSVEVNCFYQGIVDQKWVDVDTNGYASTATIVSGVPQGTGAGERLGDSIRYRRIRFCFHIRPAQAVDPGAAFPGPTAGNPLDAEYSYAARLIIGIDKMPVIGGATYLGTGAIGLGPTFPFSFASTHVNPRATLSGGTTVYPGQMLQAVRNPQTLSRYHILYDRIHARGSSKYEQATILTSSGTTAATGYYRTSSEHIELDFDLHGMVSQWYDQTNVGAVLTNRLFFLVVGDAPAANPVRYKWMSELEFVNAP